MVRAVTILGAAQAVTLLLSGPSLADTRVYGGFSFYPELPGVLILTGEINANDSFELRRAMRDQEISLVVTVSPGGNLYEGLQIGAILNDNEIATYVPEGASCESSCANVFFGGVSRFVAGELGVHQFFSGAPDASVSAPKDVMTTVAQYTTADIIGIMNQFDTPPFVFEKMFGTTDIYYFSVAEKAQLNRGLEDTAFTSKLNMVDRFLSQNTSALTRLIPTALPDIGTSRLTTEAPVLPTPIASLEDAAIALLVSINSDWSLPNDQAILRISDYYGGTVNFYGNGIPHAKVMAEKWTFAQRWPVRNYRVEPGSVQIDCTSEGCAVSSVISWAAASPERGASASGRSTWNLVLVKLGEKLVITGESGKTLSRD
jgi:hypothetical protein